MPSPTLPEVCDALAVAVGSISGLRAKGYVDDQINPPEAHVFTRPYDPRLVFGSGTSYGASEYSLGVRVYVPRTNMRSAQLLLRSFMETTGSSSVLAAIEDGASWTATIDHASVTGIGQPFEYAVEGVGGAVTFYWAVDFDVSVVW